MKRRDWTEARAKVDDEAQCRACGMGGRLEAAHLWPRSMGGTQDPDGIVPLCPRCHVDFDAHKLNVGHVLSTVEQAELVRQAGSIARAYRRAFPTNYRDGVMP